MLSTFGKMFPQRFRKHSNGKVLIEANVVLASPLVSAFLLCSVSFLRVNYVFVVPFDGKHYTDVARL